MPKKTLNKKSTKRPLRLGDGLPASAILPVPTPAETDFDMTLEVTKLEGELRAITKTKPAQRYVTVKAIERFLGSRLLQEIKSHCVAQAPTHLEPQTVEDLKRLRGLMRCSVPITLYGLQWQRAGQQLVHNRPGGELVLSHRAAFELIQTNDQAPFSIVVYKSGERFTHGHTGSVTIGGPDLPKLIWLAVGMLVDHTKMLRDEAIQQFQDISLAHRQVAIATGQSTKPPKGQAGR